MHGARGNRRQQRGHTGQKEQADLDDDDTRIQLIGPLARWATGTGAFLMLSGGWKNNLGPADDTWYGRATAVVEF